MKFLKFLTYLTVLFILSCIALVVFVIFARANVVESPGTSDEGIDTAVLIELDSDISPQVVSDFDMNAAIVDFELELEQEDIDQEPNAYPVVDGEISQEFATPAQSKVWELYKAVSDKNNEQFVSELKVYFDSDDTSVAYVESAQFNNDKWSLGVNLFDLGENRFFVETIVHEYAHVLTINETQVSSNLISRASCSSYLLSEGCARNGSYVNDFYNKFWFQEYPDWSDTLSQGELLEFYQNNSDSFVNDYSATNPIEDMAESFTQFVMYDKPELTRTMDDKVKFFYDYPELVGLRLQIRANLIQAL